MSLAMGVAASCTTASQDGSSASADATSSTAHASTVVVDTSLPAGEPATWVIAPREEPSGQTTSFTALVTGVKCSNGETGRVLDPSIQETDAAIIITFTVQPAELGDCPSNNQVAYQVELDEPIGSRSLVDGLCSAAPRLSNSVFCADGDQRWPTN